jgi:hypothetical protein
MPQVKIGHLRAIPAPTCLNPKLRDSLGKLGERLIERNAGLQDRDRARLDDMIFECYGLSTEQRATVTSGWTAMSRPSNPIKRSAGGS